MSFDAISLKARLRLKLAMYKHHLGKDKSEKYVLSLCKKLGIPTTGKVVSIESGGHTQQIDLSKEISYVMENGCANVLQSMHDSRDHFLSPPMSLGISSDVPGLRINLSSNYCGHSSVVADAGHIEPPELSFSTEICLYRQDAVESMNRGDLPTFCRNYRAFLQSSVSLIECFLHRYTFHVKNLIPSMDEYHNTAILNSRGGLEERLDAWIQTFATHREEDFKRSASRSKFIELKTQRNSIVHPSLPTIGYSIKDVVKYLNYARDGIGGLLSDLRTYSGASPDIGFIRKIATLPEIRIIKH